jgi:hypothetical protein
VRILFLDIDGVLNDHRYHPDAESCTLLPACVDQLNRVVHATGAGVVVSSAWRYMVHGGAMALDGFGYLLRSHGVTRQLQLLCITAPDEEMPTRGRQIERWLAGVAGVDSFVVLDDAPEGLDFDPVTHRLVRTDPKKGLTKVEADQAIRMLVEGRARVA